MRADSVTDDTGFQRAIPGKHSCLQCFVINRDNETLNKFGNKDMDQIRKHSTSDEHWYDFLLFWE